MKVIAPVIIGGRTYQLEVEGETMADIVRQIGPWQDLEQFAKKDAVFSYRKSPDGKFEFYALFSASENKELPLGIRTSPKGQLFAGKMADEGKSKRLVRQWQPVQYSGQEEHEQPEQAGNGQQAGQGTKPQSSASDEQDEKRAHAFVAMQLVQITQRDGTKPVRWTVGQDGTGAGKQEVWLDGANNPQCTCPELISLRTGQPDYACPHIRAVRIYHKQIAERAKQKAG